MRLTAELSLYPFIEDFKAPVKRFIAELNKIEGLKIQTFPTATIILGEDEVVMEAIRQLLRWNVEQQGQAALVVKFLANYEAI